MTGRWLLAMKVVKLLNRDGQLDSAEFSAIDALRVHGVAGQR
jgi:hypothetical protein